MRIIEKNHGTKIPYEINETTITFNQELSLDLATYEVDFDVHLDITRNELGKLVIGLSKEYVAEIDIQARKYQEVDTGETDEEGNPMKTLEPVPFSLDNVTLTLWEVID